jgi:phospholipid/cholesterol/gamma-HCH transport system permease protein
VTAARLTTADRDGGPVLRFAGRLDSAGAGEIWSQAMAAARAAAGRKLSFDLSGLEVIDTAGATLLLELETAHGAPAELTGASDNAQALLDQVRATRKVVKPPPPVPPLTWRETIVGGVQACAAGIVFLGELAVALATLPARARMFRRRDLLAAADNAGVRAVPLVLLLGVLIGLILAFQSLIPMRRFGADIYVANLVAISLIRELGPLLAAVILAGRSGSAFAAEIGTMKVNQEIDALTTMGLDPMTMLVLPRVLASIAVMPALTIVLDFAGLLGMALVLVGNGIPLVAVSNQVQAWVTPGDLYGALAKAAIFGAAIAAIGCRAGLGTGVGPQAVGISATAAVVGGIVGAIVLDGLFAIIFYRLGL